jgi:hypothetical protein
VKKQRFDRLVESLQDVQACVAAKHHPFRTLTEGFSAVRKARIADKVSALEAAIARREQRKARRGSRKTAAHQLQG